MKISKPGTIKLAGTAALLIAFFAIVSCDSQNQRSTDTMTPGMNSDIKPPETDLHTAVLSDNLDALKQHIAAGSNLDEKDPFGGSSPLITAAVFGKPEAARLLIDAGADLDFQNNDGSTALHTAAFFCHPEIVKMLLDKGADKTIRNSYGATPLDGVSAPFEESKNAYDIMGKMLEPMGLKLDYDHLKTTRPEIAGMLK